MKKQAIQQPFGLSPDEISFYFRSNVVEMTHQKMTSVLFDTDMIVEVGDIVFFSYIEHYNCYQDGRWVETDKGDMMLMQYDQLICCHPDFRGAVPRMLNGYCLIEPISIESVFGTNLYKKAGIYISNRKQDIEVLKRKTMLGYVRHFGEPNRAYIEMSDINDGLFDFEVGDIVMYNPKFAPTLEYGLHKAHFGGNELVKIHRRHIYCQFNESFKKDVKSLVKDFNSN